MNGDRQVAGELPPLGCCSGEKTKTQRPAVRTIFLPQPREQAKVSRKRNGTPHAGERKNRAHSARRKEGSHGGSIIGPALPQKGFQLVRTQRKILRRRSGLVEHGPSGSRAENRDSPRPATPFAGAKGECRGSQRTRSETEALWRLALFGWMIDDLAALSLAATYSCAIDFA